MCDSLPLEGVGRGSYLRNDPSLLLRSSGHTPLKVGFEIKTRNICHGEPVEPLIERIGLRQAQTDTPLI